MEKAPEGPERVRRDGRDQAVALALVLFLVTVAAALLPYLIDGELRPGMLFRPLIFLWLGERLVAGKNWARYVLALFSVPAGVLFLLAVVGVDRFDLAVVIAGMAGVTYLAGTVLLFLSEPITAHVTPSGARGSGSASGDA